MKIEKVTNLPETVGKYSELKKALSEMSGDDILKVTVDDKADIPKIRSVVAYFDKDFAVRSDGNDVYVYIKAE